QQSGRPPVQLWDPPFCGDMDITIKKDGAWWYMGTPIARMPLVKLFASVLTIRDNEYFLVTPVEKVRIQVEQTPFIVTQWRQQTIEQEQGEHQVIVFTTNLGDEFVLSAQHPLVLADDVDQQAPYITVHRGLTAALHRNVYYQLADIAREQETGGTMHWVIQSGDAMFNLG
ncbi:MAG: hypothetical protein ACI8WB_004342, partial [Phenylobacterium sp.]